MENEEWKPDFTQPDPYAGMPPDYAGKVNEGFVPTPDQPVAPHVGQVVARNDDDGTVDVAKPSGETVKLSNYEHKNINDSKSHSDRVEALRQSGVLTNTQAAQAHFIINKPNEKTTDRFKPQFRQPEDKRSYSAKATQPDNNTGKEADKKQAGTILVTGVKPADKTTKDEKTTVLFIPSVKSAVTTSKTKADGKPAEAKVLNIKTVQLTIQPRRDSMAASRTAIGPKPPRITPKRPRIGR